MPDDFKQPKRMIGWVEQLKRLKNGDSFFAPNTAKATLANAMTQFRKSLPEDERELFRSNIVERVEGGIQGTRFWMWIDKPQEEDQEEDETARAKKNFGAL